MAMCNTEPGTARDMKRRRNRAIAGPVEDVACNRNHDENTENAQNDGPWVLGARVKSLKLRSSPCFISETDGSSWLMNLMFVGLGCWLWPSGKSWLPMFIDGFYTSSSKVIFSIVHGLFLPWLIPAWEGPHGWRLWTGWHFYTEAGLDGSEDSTVAFLSDVWLSHKVTKNWIKPFLLALSLNSICLDFSCNLSTK